ncbi:Sec-independent protein translocase protein TatA [Geomonas limicola]|uniref:Sec-independent protein translocase protein TatA n=1 Tax=Geomonas limicola TaxID=2740186 RepID=A0A6V8NAI0_9BACT|nr:twin-arginine translocase TatA/TatE family subunit [Geomonas limicola]GFO68817.1 Sec-independent protein translocase protein TatA [Geomonas limicola]
MFGIGMPELIVILFIVLLVFGAGKLPEAGRALGQSLRNFKAASDEKEHLEQPKS